MFFKKKIIVATHSGNFHPDDVFSVALLSILYKGKIKVVRTRGKDIYSKADFLIDVGHEHDVEEDKYDHHQEGGAGKRENGISYSTFGILWKEYGEKVCGSKKVADLIDKKLVQIIDADDAGVNLCQSQSIPGVYPFLMTDIVYSMYPTWLEPKLHLDRAFLNAVKFAKKVLEREIKITKDKIESESIVDKIYQKSEDKRIIIIDNPYLSSSILSKYPEPLFIIKPAKDSTDWKITAIRKEEQSFESRKKFPESWIGKKDKELREVTGTEDATFCHLGVFAGAETKEGAIKLAKLAVDN